MEAADWDRDLSLLRVSEVGQWGQPRVEHGLVLDDAAPSEPPGSCSWSASGSRRACCWSGTCRSRGRRGVRVVGRRAPCGAEPVQWVYEYDAGIDPDRPRRPAAAETALATAQDDVDAVD